MPAVQPIGRDRAIDPAEVVRLYEELLSIREIAARLASSYGTIHRIITAHTTPRPVGHRPRGSDGLVPCGTKTAYQRHLDHGEDPDEVCRQANRDYMNDFNARTGTSKARNRAYRLLARTHPKVFAELYAAERQQTRGEPGTAKARSGRARERAHRQLAQRFPEEFAAVFADEKQQAAAGAPRAGEAENGT